MDKMRFPTWDKTRVYAAGDLVLYGASVYRAMGAIPAGRPPATYTGDWERMRGAGIDSPPLAPKLDQARRLDPRIGRGA